MEQDGVWNINGHALPPLCPIQIMHKMHHQLQQQEEEEREKRKKMKLNSSPDWLGLTDKTYHNFSTKDITPSFPSTRTMDHPFLQLHPYHHHHHHRHHHHQQQQQVLPEMAIAKSSLEWELGSNMRIEDNESRINPTHDFRGSSINLVSNVDGGGVHKWYNNSPEEEWERRAGLRSNDHTVDPTGFFSNNNIHQSFMNYTGNTINSSNNNTVLKGGGSSSRNSKDRYSKVFTAKGIRDRRIRLAASTATQFYDIQDRLGYEQPSEVVDWLMIKARASIDQLPRMEPYSTLLSRHSTASLDLPIIATIKPNSDASHNNYGSSTNTHQIQDISGKPHADEEKEKVGKVVSGVEMRLADETSPLPSLPFIRTVMSFADASSSSSFPASGLQLREDSLKLCRSDRR